MFRKLTEIVLFNHSPAGGKKQTSRRDPRLFFLYDSHDINCYFSCKKYLENKSFFARFHVSAGGMYAIFNKTPAFVIF